MSTLGALFQDSEDRETVYRPDPLGRVGEGEWETPPVGDPEDQAARFDQFRDAWGQGAGLKDLFGDDPFSLGDSVGIGGRNRRPDVAKVQTFLGRTGHLDLVRTEGPTGYLGGPVDQAIRDFQTDNNLAVDGILLPKGETIRSLKGILSGETEEQDATRERELVQKPEDRNSSTTWELRPGAGGKNTTWEWRPGYVRDSKTGVMRPKTEAEERQNTVLWNDKPEHGEPPAAPDAPAPPTQPTGAEDWPPAQGMDYDGPIHPPAAPYGVTGEFLKQWQQAEQGKDQAPDWKQTNSNSTAQGAYQITLSGLRDAGFKDAEGNWTEKAAQYGVKSDEDFRQKPEAQMAAANDLARAKEDHLSNLGADKHIGQKIDGVKAEFQVTRGGLVAAALREGQGTVKAYLEHQAKNDWKSDFSNIDQKTRDKFDLPSQGRDTEDRFRAIETRMREFEKAPYRR